VDGRAETLPSAGEVGAVGDEDVVGCARWRGLAGGAWHQLNRGGNGDANHARWCIAMTRLRYDPEKPTGRSRPT